MNKNCVNTIDALAVAIFAFQQNEQKVVKEIRQWPDASIKQWPNKNYLVSTFTKVSSDNFAYPQPVTITNELREQAENLKLHIEQSMTMAMLTKGQVNPFLQSIYLGILNDEVHTSTFGLLVWVPKVMLDNQRSDATREISSTYERNSKFVGKEGDRITVNFTLIEKRYIRNVDTWAAYGHDEHGNLISFLTKKEHLVASGQIKGRIKGHEESRYRNNAKITKLNHVKEQ